MAVIEEREKKTHTFPSTKCVYKGKLKPTLLTLITLEYSFPSYVLDDAFFQSSSSHGSSRWLPDDPSSSPSSSASFIVNDTRSQVAIKSNA